MQQPTEATPAVPEHDKVITIKDEHGNVQDLPVKAASIEFGPTGRDKVTIKDKDGNVLDLPVRAVKVSLPSFDGVATATVTLERVQVAAAFNDLASIDTRQALPSTSLLPANPHREAFKKDLAKLLNRHSCEVGSNTPDFLLSNLLAANLDAFDRVVNERAAWYGRGDTPGQDSQDPALLDGVMGECAKLRLQNGALMQGLSLLATLTPEVVQDPLDPLRMAREMHARLLGKLHGLAAVQDDPAQLEIMRSKIEVLENDKQLLTCAKEELGKRNYELAELWRSVSDSHHKAQVRIRELETKELRADNQVASLKKSNEQLAEQANRCRAREDKALKELAAWSTLRKMVRESENDVTPS